MKIKFNIKYTTKWGESVWIYGSVPELGLWDKELAVPLGYVSETEWSKEIEIEASQNVEYRYFVKESDGSVREEWGENHCLALKKGYSYTINQLWQAEPEQKHLYSSAFKKSFFHHKTKKLPPIKANKTTVLEVLCPYVDRNQNLILIGESEYLGNWQIENAIEFTPTEYGKWVALLDYDRLRSNAAYRLAIYDKSKKEIVHWEENGNRHTNDQFIQNSHPAICIETIAYQKKQSRWKGAGVAVPVFSLRTKSSSGIGEFPDLKMMIDWAIKTGQKIVQILPVNDTTSTHTWADSYPYKAISVYALHPLYLGLKNHPLRDTAIHTQYEKEFERLNRLETIDYESVDKLKWEYFRLLYNEIGTEVLASSGYQQFESVNHKWLLPYACFCFLRDRNKNGIISQWKGFERYDEVAVQKLLKSNKSKKATQFYCFLQFLLHKQLWEVKKYAHQRGVILKGDVPIGVHPDGVDVWVEPHLFNLNVCAGAPPDDFAVNGQNWGFPTYKWCEMAKNDYHWWINRFKKMSDYFDAYRIDHILGFFRIWEIPKTSVHALLGYFNPALPFSEPEIRKWGLNFDLERMVTPYIHDKLLRTLFEKHAVEVISQYLDPASDNRYHLKECYNTQIKIQNAFKNKSSKKNSIIQEGLYWLCNEVLFVRDGSNGDKYHPAIASHRTHVYKDLCDEERRAFDNMYYDYFYQRHNQFWREKAMNKLPQLINATDMLVCGEDLGMIPESVPSVMSELQILSLEIERMPKNPSSYFENLSLLPYLSVCSPSTHDMAPIRLWWKENKDITQSYYTEKLDQKGNAPTDCSEDMCRQIIQHQITSSSMLAIIPLQDWLSIDHKYCFLQPEKEQINLPSNPNHHWAFRMFPYIEDLLKAEKLNLKIQDMIEKGNRR